ncbi:hypothetical protein TYRP_013984 [Tyrophagus putrescentiae]|nr:hypothetical protein TYRP_013984 [Tyrophagus putrescentiae]
MDTTLSSDGTTTTFQNGSTTTDYRSADRDTLQTVGGKNHVWRDHWPKGKVVPSPPTREDRQENKTTKIPGRRKGETFIVREKAERRDNNNGSTRKECCTEENKAQF